MSNFLELIKKEAINKNPVFESYKTVCEKIGEDIDFLEFEYFHMAYYNNPEFKGTNYDGSAKPKFSQLPPEILTEILGKLDPVYRLILRKVSKRLRSIIDNEVPRISSIVFDESDNYIQIDLDSSRVTFLPHSEGCTVEYGIGKTKFIPECAHHEMALVFLRPILLNPKLRLRNLSMLSSNDFNYAIEYFSNITAITSEFHVENFIFRMWKPLKVAPAIALVKPGSLESIEIESKMRFRSGIMQFLETSHFKQAKEVKTWHCEPLNPVVIDRFVHLTSFEIRMHYVSFVDVRRLRKMILQSPTFEQCKIYLFWYLRREEVEKAFGPLVKEDSNFYHRYPIPNSSYFIQFKFYDHLIEAEKFLRE
ncbi:hypothetical protein CAEBREN_25223 [Caenorhabditis brenneri]|uniref:F-box domain-containing protein n=1 Tax=Caenorhabditis brenneri TaxID=135651 RepID=G0MW10_CAEBE|nr:hypothetical protein CAEBREN_25223 [Caenorhabditis brenneri]